LRMLVVTAGELEAATTAGEPRLAKRRLVVGRRYGGGGCDEELEWGGQGGETLTTVEKCISKFDGR